MLRVGKPYIQDSAMKSSDIYCLIRFVRVSDTRRTEVRFGGGENR